MKTYLKKKTMDYNIFWCDIKYRLSGLKRCKKIRKMMKEIGGIDSIENYHQFAEKISRYLGTEFLSIPCYGSESLHYGHVNSFFEYCGMLKQMDVKVFPAIEHGISLRVRDENEIRIYPNFVYQSEYKREQIHSRNPLKPVFHVGPYIHYSRDYYEEDKAQRFKEKYGRILTVFLLHGCENYDLNTDASVVEEFMQHGTEEFDTVMVCVYWNDVNKEVYKRFEEKGAILVSAGYREDPNFMPRLKTILSISDKIVSNGIGTFTGYAYYMNKPIEIIGSDSVDKEAPVFQKFLSFFPKGELTEMQRMKQKELIEFYWGKESDILSREQMKKLITLNRKIIKYSKGVFDNLDSTIEMILNSEKILDAEEKELLRGSLGIL